MIGTIGADAWGQLALKHLRKAGVDLTLVGTGERRTACGFISVDAAGQTLIAVSPGANMETRADAIAKLRTPLSKGDWLMLADGSAARRKLARSESSESRRRPHRPQPRPGNACRRRGTRRPRHTDRQISRRPSSSATA